MLIQIWSNINLRSLHAKQLHLPMRAQPCTHNRAASQTPTINQSIAHTQTPPDAQNHTARELGLDTQTREAVGETSSSVIIVCVERENTQEHPF